MTEGIIQKIFAQYLEHYKEAIFRPEIIEPRNLYKNISNLERELIEAIKQEFNNIHYNRNNKELAGFYKVWIDYFTRILIGDNKE